MKLTSQILIVLVLILGAFFVFQISGVHAGFVFWADRADIEESKVAGDLHVLNDAVDQYAAARHETDMVAYGPDAQAIIAYKAERAALKHYAAEAEEAYLSARAATEELNRALDSITLDVPGTYKDMVDNLIEQVQQRASTKSGIQTDIASMLANTTRARSSYAVDYERFLLVEYEQYLQQEDLERMRETLYRYRWLRPDLQAEVGDTGHHVTGNVIAATSLAVIIDKGRRDGVELYQKFTVQRDGRVIAVVDIVEVRNDEAEGEIRAIIADGMSPQPGDIVVPQTFIGGFSTSLPGR